MQLSKIKLAGFKSFVDPTTLAVPSHLVAIVGPNGCGKSNIIDAVTWVMGESSPKYLRGEALTDVIFNGSSVRKPVGQASVELVFDNADGSIGGEYAKFAEISVKRQINRDSDSVYYLNGVRCRKRDIVDIFLGTGLGPRSYSIIGQNMISRVIEAKPDELRTYLEEAAGISKYKERRHETELRINHTKENLARVNDLRGELEKQLNHLKHQANVAEKYKGLKQQERVLRAELYGIQWRELDSKMVSYTLEIQCEETALEARQSELSGTDRELEQCRHEQRVAQDGFQEVQRRYYAVGNEITRIEQDILHHQEREQQWQSDLKQTEHDWQTVSNQMNEAEDNLRDLEHDINSVEPQLSSAIRESNSLKTRLDEADEAMQTLQNQWDDFHQANAKTTQTAQVEKAHIQHLEQQIVFLQKRQDQVHQEQHQFNFSELTKQLEEFSKKSFEVADQIEIYNKDLAGIRTEINAKQLAQKDSNTNLDNIRNELQKLRGQQASLEALQQTALGQRDHSSTPWITKHQLSSKPRLAQNIQVEAGWELSVEKVLGFCLQAVCVDDLHEVVPHLDSFKSGKICIFRNNHHANEKNNQTKGTLLLDKVKSQLPLESLLSGIYVADSLDEALKLCESLSDNESVMTRDGIWLNKSWLKILREDDPAAGVFQREQELKQLTARIEQLQQTHTELVGNIAERNEEIKALEQKRDQLQQSCTQQQAQSAQLNAQQKMKQERLDELKAQSVRVMRELEECVNQLEKSHSELVEVKKRWQQAMDELSTQAMKREELVT
ncbi:MAG: hypothetical protein ACD_46C00203G0011, partial [uncultured bacterium]